MRRGWRYCTVPGLTLFSTSSHGVCPRSPGLPDRVDGGVQISIETGATGTALIRPFTQGQLGFHRAHDEQALLGAQKRGAFTSVEPYHWVLYSSWRTNSPQSASLMCSASEWFFSIPATFRSSTAMRP
jgi:hypothetical protein